MGGWRSKHSQNSITDELFDKAAITSNFLSQSLEAAHHETSEVLRVELFGQTGEPHHVGKQHSHGSTLRLGGHLG